MLPARVLPDHAILIQVTFLDVTGGENCLVLSLMMLGGMERYE